ncbi:hypothetical protein SOVF_140150 [Spinacia oleracea]|nr:hypothetical protein SOVF_140150 [Spinacia oleracea]
MQQGLHPGPPAPTLKPNPRKWCIILKVAVVAGLISNPKSVVEPCVVEMDALAPKHLKLLGSRFATS